MPNTEQSSITRLPKPGDKGRNDGATEKLASYMQQLQEQGELDGYSFFLSDNREANPDDFAASIHRLLKADIENKGSDVTEAILRGEQI